ncbi:hypothetical protein [uncultured Methanolobus sp.]|uniref:hypothetical protein n=1 Tax=uncultured Methanolobus sp. TaxID=218300 RepID=UPI002AAC0DB2|nr:hypothetical protein [uncultured Methanolobus sp.]
MELDENKLTYEYIDSIFKARINDNLATHANMVSVFHIGIETSLCLNESLQLKFLEKSKVTGKSFSGPQSFVSLLFLRNSNYLIATEELALRGLANSSYLNLRVVFEGITLIYLLYLTEIEASLFYKKQLGILTPKEESDLKKKYNWLGPKTVRSILYSGEKKDQLEMFYHELSNFAHASVKGLMMDIESKKGVVGDILGTGLMLMVSNLIAIYDIYFDIIEEKEKKKIEQTCDEIVKELEGQWPDLAPNSPEFIDKLKFNFQQ